jgi:hypothetical protein
MAETAADLTFNIILHTARTQRLIEHHARNPKLPGLETVIDKMINATFKSPVGSGLEGAVQMAINNALFVNLSKLALHKEASAETKAITFLKLDQLKNWLLTKITTDEEWKAHYALMIRQINSLLEKPDEYKVNDLLPPPPGMPIGECEMDYLNHK